MRKRSRRTKHFAPIDYHRSHVLEAPVGDRTFEFVSKPGIASWNRADIDTQLLADCAQLLPGQRILCVGCRHGLLGAVLAYQQPDVSLWLLDSSVVAVRAAQRTMDLYKASQVQVLLSDGLWEVRSQRFDQVLINLPRGRMLVNQLIEDAFHVLDTGGLFYLAGANREGIKSYARKVVQAFGNSEVARLGGKHRVISAVKRAQEMPHQPANDVGTGYHDYTHFDVSVHGQTYHIVSKPGIFSWDRLDEGTRVLLDHLDISQDDIVLDLGCGCGIIGTVAATMAARGHAYLVDAHVAAVNASRRTVDANGITNATTLISDVASDVRHIAFDAVATNLPFHLGIETEYQVALQFIKDAHAVLKTGGWLYLVANRFLEYESLVGQEFGGCRTIYSDNRYKVLRARRGPE